MYLKALEIQGFKSFPQKTRLVFEKPVTAVVGPNGSGKSNISDAIRWVMGEQSSKALRGGKMEDVIFGGTEKRQQVGFAEVSLVLDNSGHTFDVENSEVMITRRYYRSGESEYYINKQSVRLKDVNELLMDTGLGREGYSIIGQGRIDEILSIKSTERREIFEEAAGISRFRHRKEESESKLLKAEDNLLRVNDKIAELELQVEPLRKQSETAKKYLVLRDELRELEVAVWMHNLDKLQKQGEKLETDFNAVQNQLKDARAELEQLYSSGEMFFEKMREKDVDAENVRNRISEAESSCAGIESEIAVLKANLQNNIENIERISGEIKQQENRDESIENQIAERKTRLAEIELEKSEIEKETVSLNSKAESLAGKAGVNAEKLSEAVEKKSGNMAAIASDEARLKSLASALQEAEDKSSNIIFDINDAEARLESAKKELENTERSFDEASEKIQSLKNIISGHNMRLEGRRRKSAAAADKKVKTTMELNAIRSRISLLTEMEREYAGYSKSVKAVMQESARGTLKNVHGPVAELLKTEDRFTVAIETALGAAAQNIIVGNENDGKAAINMLKRRDAGRATFLPVSIIKGSRLKENGIESCDGFEGVAVDLVSFDEKYRNIYTYLLGRIIVSDNMDSAIKTARMYSNRFKIVTLDGQVINAGGSMTGGSTSKNAGILSRANELENLAFREKEISRRLDAEEQEHAKLQRDVSAAEYELKVASDELRTFEDDILKLESAKEHGKFLVKSISERKDELRAEQGSLSEVIEKNTEEISAVRVRIKECEEENRILDGEISEITAGNSELEKARQEILDDLYKLKADEASLGAENEALVKSIEELDVLRRDLTGGREQQQNTLIEYEKQNEQIKGEIERKLHECQAVNSQIAGYREKIAKITEEKMQLEAKRARHDKETQEKNESLLALERECARFEQKKLSAEMEEKQIVDKLWDNYELSRSAAMNIAKELENVPDAVKKIGEIKREISRLGNPNIGAIDEFERVNTRYTYLTDQRDDIEKSKKELLDIIGDITDEMSEIFRTGFEQINEGFQETFVDLFGGGRATLELEDPDDVLNCGIEIKVQPPGKSLKTITLLSGGEKAFVAIALYFAILKVRPTPFVVMDEIEAALDEANVTRFATYMRRLTTKTQFVVITHRRNTMEEADVLYGVTMQEQGVSQIINVDLEEAEKAIAK